MASIYGYLGIAGIAICLGAFIYGLFYGRKIKKGELEKEYLQGYNDSQKSLGAEKLATYNRLAGKLEPLIRVQNPDVSAKCKPSTTSNP